MFVAPLLAVSALSGADAAYAVAVVLLGYTVFGASGFGSALVIVPLLVWRWPLTLVVPLVLLLDVPAAAWHARLNLPHVDWRALGRLVPGIAAGLAAALAVPTGGVQPLLLGLLGAYVVAVAVRGLFARAIAVPGRPGGPAALALGTAAGWIEVTFGTSGPLFAAWFNGRLPGLQAARATIPVALAGTAVLALAGLGAKGQLSVALLWGVLPVLLGVALLGMRIGHRIAAALPERHLAACARGVVLDSRKGGSVLALPME